MSRNNLIELVLLERKKESNFYLSCLSFLFNRKVRSPVRFYKIQSRYGEHFLMNPRFSRACSKSTNLVAGGELEYARRSRGFAQPKYNTYPPSVFLLKFFSPFYSILFYFTSVEFSSPSMSNSNSNYNSRGSPFPDIPVIFALSIRHRPN